MGEAARRKANKTYPEYKRLPYKYEEYFAGRDAIGQPIFKQRWIGHGKQLAIRDGRA